MLRATILAMLATCCMAQHLRVAAAGRKSVRLEWDGSGQDWKVDRKTEGGSWQKLAAATAAKFEDTSVAPYATYRYRVSAGPKTSNEVVVGPPPAGILTAAPAPKAGEPANYGTNAAITPDENGDPAIAFVWFDPNGDGNMADSEVH